MYGIFLTHWMLESHFLGSAPTSSFSVEECEITSQQSPSFQELHVGKHLCYTCSNAARLSNSGGVICFLVTLPAFWNVDSVLASPLMQFFWLGNNFIACESTTSTHLLKCDVTGDVCSSRFVEFSWVVVVFFLFCLFLKEYCSGIQFNSKMASGWTYTWEKQLITPTHTYTLPVQSQVHCDRGSLSSGTGWR